MNFLSDTTPRCVRDGRCQMKQGHPMSRMSDSVMNIESIGGLHVDTNKSSLKLKCSRGDCDTQHETNVVRGFRVYHSCHFCHAYYCSRQCRLMDWCKHKTICAHSRTESICKNVLRKLVTDESSCILFDRLSLCGKEGHYLQGRGYIMLIIEHFYSLEDIWNGVADVKIQYIPLMNNKPRSINTSSCKLGQGIVKLFEDELHRHCLIYNLQNEFILRILVPVRGVQYYQPKSNRHYIDKFMELKFNHVTISGGTTSSRSSSSITNVTSKSQNGTSESYNNPPQRGDPISKSENSSLRTAFTYPSLSTAYSGERFKTFSLPP